MNRIFLSFFLYLLFFNALTSPADIKWSHAPNTAKSTATQPDFHNIFDIVESIKNSEFKKFIPIIEKNIAELTAAYTTGNPVRIEIINARTALTKATEVLKTIYQKNNKSIEFVHAELQRVSYSNLDTLEYEKRINTGATLFAAHAITGCYKALDASISKGTFGISNSRLTIKTITVETDEQKELIKHQIIEILKKINNIWYLVAINFFNNNLNASIKILNTELSIQEWITITNEKIQTIFEKTETATFATQQASSLKQEYQRSLQQLKQIHDLQKSEIQEREKIEKELLKITTELSAQNKTSTQYAALKEEERERKNLLALQEIQKNALQNIEKLEKDYAQFMQQILKEKQTILLLNKYPTTQDARQEIEKLQTLLKQINIMLQAVTKSQDQSELTKLREQRQKIESDIRNIQSLEEMRLLLKNKFQEKLEQITQEFQKLQEEEKIARNRIAQEAFTTAPVPPQTMTEKIEESWKKFKNWAYPRTLYFLPTLFKQTAKSTNAPTSSATPTAKAKSPMEESD